MNIKRLFFAGAFALFVSQISAQTNVIAHRGFWQTDGSAQNSIAALVKADSINCYGSEFDVWLTKDNKLIVNHDASFMGQRMEDSNYEQLQKLRLKNGETMPGLSDYLTEASKLKTKLILELKEQSSAERESEAVKKIVAMVHDMKLEDRMEYISFSKHAVKEFIRLAPQNTPVYYLKGDLTPAQLKEIGASGADYHLSVFQKNPQLITECHQLGLKVNVWTVNNTEDFQWCITNQVDFITTNEPITLQNVLKNK
ncbi:MAG: glycerophosphodiester phosphodiesterase [Bacteroides sp.]|nr:glycerophosphodiester phosphodiesterase [Bacteroides sp.]